MRFHNLQTTAEQIRAAFDTDILTSLDPDEVNFAQKLFHRRHIYEHNGGVVDEKYLKDSSDTSVRLRQAIHETQDSAHRLIGVIAKMADNLHKGFHDIFPPEEQPIRLHTEREQRAARFRPISR